MRMEMRRTALPLAAMALLLAAPASAGNRKIFVNKDVTTLVVMPETIRMVDISTRKVAGNQCADNIVRIKPYVGEDSLPGPGGYAEGEMLATMTLIGERAIAQYDLVYTAYPSVATTVYKVRHDHSVPYVNPEVTMPTSEMARYAWAIYGSSRKYNQLVSTANGMRATVNNIYAVGDYFFIDYSLRNLTNIPYDIEELRVKLTDKKETKAANSQTVELAPVYSLNPARRFKRDYRNVLVIPKLTFPEEKMLRIEISEAQISGRVIAMAIEYGDILDADAFDAALLRDGGAFPRSRVSRDETPGGTWDPEGDEGE